MKDAPNNHQATSSAVALSMPAIIGMILLIIGPALAIVLMAFTEWSFGDSSFKWVGMDNFLGLIDDNRFKAAIGNTLLYVIVTVPVTISIALFLTLLIESRKFLRSFYRAAHFLPVMATLAAMALVWEAMLHPTLGGINEVAGWLGAPQPNWLRDRSTALPSLMMIGVWQHLGLAVVLFMAGLRSIPKEVFDAAQVDGADGAIDKFRVLIWPLLGPTTLFVSIIIALRAYRVFDKILVLTQGRPGYATESLMHTIYAESFLFLNTGYGAAAALVFFVGLLGLTFLQVKVGERRVHYT